MAEEFYSLVTDYGSQKQINSIKNGTPFDVLEIVLGDSNGSYNNDDNKHNEFFGNFLYDF